MDVIIIFLVGTLAVWILGRAVKRMSRGMTKKTVPRHPGIQKSIGRA